MTVALLEPFSGIAGDMTVAAFLDLGYPIGALRESLGTLPLGGFSIRSEPVERRGMTGTRFTVETDEDHPHRGLPEIREILSAGRLPDRVRERALAAFEALAVAEGAVHGRPPEEIHFHEVGAVDAIVDVVGAALALEHFDVDEVRVGRVRVGTGEIECRHGRIPAPAPAAARLIEGFPVLVAEGEGETVTPTGAAILASWAEPLPAEFPFVAERHGYGAGSRDDTALPNLLRVTLGRPGGPAGDRVVELAANLDDQTPETAAYARERLLEAGARDAWFVPATMKKGRPGFVLGVLADPSHVGRLEEVIFRETTTFGVRRTWHARTVLDRERVEVETPYGRVRVKLGRRDGELLARAPEYEDCARAARESGVPLREVYEAAVRAVTDPAPPAPGDAPRRSRRPS